MATKITDRMKDTPLQSSSKCDGCKHYQAYKDGVLSNSDGDPPIAIMRKNCADCKDIYKFDALLRYDELRAKDTRRKPPTKQKGSNKARLYGDIIRELHTEGLSAKKIAEKIGTDKIHYKTVEGILNGSIK